MPWRVAPNHCAGAVDILITHCIIYVFQVDDSQTATYGFLFFKTNSDSSKNFQPTKSILKISRERISDTFLSLDLGEVVMKKLNAFELKWVSGGDSGEVKRIGDLIPPSTTPKDFAISSEELGRRVRIAGMNDVPEHLIAYEALKSGFQIPFYR